MNLQEWLLSERIVLRTHQLDFICFLKCHESLCGLNFKNIQCKQYTQYTHILNTIWLHCVARLLLKYCWTGNNEYVYCISKKKKKHIQEKKETLPVDLIASFSLSNPAKAYTACVQRLASNLSKENEPLPGR